MGLVIVSHSLIGMTLGHFRVLDQIGAGGMGVVYRAQDQKLGRQVALKVVPTPGGVNSEAAERFRREARTASSLNHPNICTIYAFEEHDGQLFLAMELLDGEPLDRRLSGRPLEFRTLLDLGGQVAEALDAAHAEGILHRDIKPANIFVTKRGSVKVLDFGLAKLASNHSQPSHETRQHEHFSSVVGTTVGTIAYMSPEQARGEELDARTDLFSFGVVLYEMATGMQSFPGHTTAVVFDGILNREPTPASMVNAAMPAELDRIIAKALEKDRNLRYQTAADLRADLQRLRRDSASSRRVAVANVHLPPDRDTTIPPARPSTRHTPSTYAIVSDAAISHDVLPQVPAPSSKTWIWQAAAATLLVATIAAGVAGYFAQRGGSAESAQAAADVPPAAPVTASVDGRTPPPVAPPTAPGAPPVTANSATTTVATDATAKPGAATRVPTLPAKPALAPAAVAATGSSAATEQFEVAKAKLASLLLEPALADLRRIATDFPGSPVAVDAMFLAAESLERANRLDDAMATYVEFDRRFATHPRVPDSKLRRATLLARARPPRPDAQRELLGDIARSYPGSSYARQALLQKRQVETQRRNLKDTDPVLNTEVPAVLVTLRMLADQFPQDPETMSALSQLANAYSDMDRHADAAATLQRLATGFSGNPMEVWYRLGEIYGRKLNDADKAREAYGAVPTSSPRYNDAQKRLKRR